MTDTEAKMLIQGGQCDSALSQQAWQHLLDNGHIYRMQPFYGRRAKQLLKEGVLTRPEGRH